MKILILENDNRLAEKLCGYLSTLTDEIDIHRDFKECIDCILSNDYSGLILNLDYDAYQTFSLIKKIRHHGCDIPIIVYGYFLTDLNMDECLKIDSCDFIKRPLSKAEFLFRVRFIFAQYSLRNKLSKDEKKCIKINDYLFYPESYKIWTDDKIITLTRRETEILKILAFNIKKVVSKAQILDLIWTNQEDVDENIVAVYISKLRKLFSDNNIKIRIDTVKNVGYSLINQ